MKNLKKWLLTNATFSSISGLTLIVLNNWLQSILGFKNDWVLLIIGINLLIFSACVAWVSLPNTINKRWVYTICILDAAWIIGSIIILLFSPFDLTEAASWIIGAVAIVVGVLGIQQYRHAVKTT